MTFYAHSDVAVVSFVSPAGQSARLASSVSELNRLRKDCILFVVA